ncbi:MAG: acetylornithine transaminase [Zetaproteobacteria bacterium]|nr:MAG: acetylornithine transaminase [Zetaproteobacteria bacterium]
MDNYARFPVRLARGQGSRVWDDQGRVYLDFVSGIAVNTLGHAHPRLADALCNQARRLIHCSNLYRIPEQEQLASKLATLSGLERTFFCNSGAEANEAAIKLARKYYHDMGSRRRTVITATQSFHGRTLLTLTATGQEKVKRGFDPLPAGFVHVPLNDAEVLERSIGSDTAAILLEPIQGEGGVHEASISYLHHVRRLCDENGILMVLDEVQTGIGRTGHMFAYERFGIRPDILTLAKGLGGGVPIGCMLAREQVASAFGPGSHGSTFGGNPLSCRAALTVLDAIEQEDLLRNVQDRGQQLMQGLKALARRFPCVREIRGQGLLVGMELDRDVARLIELARGHGLLVLSAGAQVLRLLPPLNVSEREIDEAVAILDAALSRFTEEEQE